MNFKIVFFILILFVLSIYISSYLYKRIIKVSAETVTVTYTGYGYRQYILDTPYFNEKLASGTFDIGGNRSYLIRFYRPIEALEMKLRFKVVNR